MIHDTPIQPFARQLFLASVFLLVIGQPGLGQNPGAKKGLTPKQAFAKKYREYLSQEYVGVFEDLRIGEDEIRVSVRLRDRRVAVDQLAIAVLPTHAPSVVEINEAQLVDAKVVKRGGRCRATIPRFSRMGLDRSACRFVLVYRDAQGKYLPLTSASYPQNWERGTQRKIKKMTATGIKGLGGIPGNSARQDHQIYDLNLSHATINIVLNGLIHNEERPGFTPWVFEGKEVYLNEKRLKQYDQRLARLRKENIVASMILLISLPRDAKQKKRHPLIHPEAENEGKFAMPDLATPAGAFFYRAIIFHLAERFSRPGDETARVSNWILHNEIDQAGTWTNMGQQPIERYMETFCRSARLVHQATRRYNPHARVFVSLTHFWSKISGGKHVYRVRDIIDIFARASVVEGDFEWGIAYHPYPENLRQPRTWDDKQVTFDFDTPLITPKNLEVLPAYLSQQRIRFEGKHERAIIFSEQGISAPSMSPEDQKLQAAGIVYMFRRMQMLPTVEAIHYHAYRDAPKVEGGARFGIVDENERPKFAWNVYKSLNTQSERTAIEFAWEIMGVDAKRQTKRLQKIASPKN